LHSHFGRLKLSYSSIDGTPFSVLWRLTIQSFVDGAPGLDRPRAPAPPRPRALLIMTSHYRLWY